MKLTYGQRLKYARKHKAWSQGKLEIESGIKQGSISKIERGDQDFSSFDIELANALDINPTWLKNGDERFCPDWLGKIGISEESASDYEDNYINSNVEPGPTIKGKVPLINYIQAGHWSEIKDHFEPLEWIDTTLKASPNTFALRVIGDSMTNPFGAPSIPEGFIVIIDPEIQAKHGSIVVARLENSNEAMIKQLIIDGPHRYLKPLNPNYRTIEITENCVICGVARKVEYDL